MFARTDSTKTYLNQLDSSWCLSRVFYASNSRALSVLFLRCDSRRFANGHKSEPVSNAQCRSLLSFRRTVCTCVSVCLFVFFALPLFSYQRIDFSCHITTKRLFADWSVADDESENGISIENFERKMKRKKIIDLCAEWPFVQNVKEVKGKSCKFIEFCPKDICMFNMNESAGSRRNNVIGHLVMLLFLELGIHFRSNRFNVLQFVSRISFYI